MKMILFRVVFSNKASSELNKFSDEVHDRIKKKLKKTRENPFHYFERLKGRDDYKLRVGNYRIIADLNLELKRAEVTKVGHRKSIYKNLE